MAADRDLRSPPPPGFVIDPTPATPWASIGRVASVALGIPVAVLILGASLVWGFFGLLCQAVLNMPSLILKRASASRPSGAWNVLADGVVVGRIMKAAAAPVGLPWLWTMLFDYRWPLRRVARDRDGGLRQELAAGVTSAQDRGRTQ